MKRSILISIAAASLVIGGAAAAAESGADLAKSKKCLTCHDVEKKKAGPAFKTTAEKYKGDKDASAKLVAALKESKHPKVVATDAELATLVEYVLSNK